MVGQASRLSCVPDRTRCNEAPVQNMRKWYDDEPHLGLPSNLQPYPCSRKFF